MGFFSFYFITKIIKKKSSGPPDRRLGRCGQSVAALARFLAPGRMLVILPFLLLGRNLFPVGILLVVGFLWARVPTRDTGHAAMWARLFNFWRSE